ncbi:nucleotide pyrophosphohydrolase [Geomonas subterranea]|uniref:Nucleotide pyrophosphohydrolase n=1 Tax=Geomonas subterranea TaxID=2847989 RepID=A0ABX8LM99_9BACT|nr:nucleotide pyrophosphohydrolase [Geomonas subterranea]QXE92803.1 nucleotide pyrophosphohydrolase [Geomonas subterranea]QXM09094.1 nucleotide pyrophosphohydrolase [Geomonas subterranea]
MDIKQLQYDLEAFAEARDWNKYHTPKNLAIALSVEASELLEIFQWLTDDESRGITNSEQDMRLITEELADIQIYLLRLSDKLKVDLEAAVKAKVVKNSKKYPVELAKGNATKYNRRGK